MPSFTDPFWFWYIIHHAIPCSAVVLSIHRLDGHRASPLMLKSLRFCSEGKIDAYHSLQESNFIFDFSESEYGDDSTISREWTRVPISILEFDDNNLQTTAQDDALEVEDEVVCCKLQQWANHSKSEDVESCNTSLQSASEMEDGAFSPESREPFTIYECDEKFEDDQQDYEPLGANSPEAPQLSPVYQSHLDFDNGQQSDEPLEPESPEPQHSSPSNLNPPSQSLTMTKRMMSHLDQTALNLDDSFYYINSTQHCTTHHNQLRKWRLSALDH